MKEYLAEAYLESCQAFMIEKFYTNIRYFCKKTFIIGLWQSSKYVPA